MPCNMYAKLILLLLTLFLSVEISGASGWLKISPIDGNVGTSCKVTGGGFTPDSNIGIFFGDKIVAIAKSNLRGEISVNVEIPEVPCGLHKIMVVDEVKRNAYTFFNVTPKITKVSSKQANAGSTITITGKGFSENSEVELRLSNLFDVKGIILEEVLAKKIVRTNEKGTFEEKFEIPVVSPGYYLLYAYDPKCGVETDYTKFEILEPKKTPVPTTTPIITPVQKEISNSEEKSMTTPQTISSTTPIKTPISKSSKSIPGFEVLIGLGSIIITFLVLRTRRI
ncbi:MAG: hypothetical protein QXU31_00420 [Archaeoglobaceae archaeon]